VIVNNSDNDLEPHLDNEGQPVKSQTPITDCAAEPRPLNDAKTWNERVMRNMRRMAVDEDYRKEIAKNLS
jgi:hypothetical protein